MKRLKALSLSFAVAGVLCAADNVLSTEARNDYKQVRGLILKSAELMPAESYGFKPAPTVRTFGGIIAHIADDQYNLCAPVKGETRKASYTEIENTLSTKAELLPALLKAFEYCDGAYDSVTDAKAADILPVGKGTRAKLSMLNFNTWHTFDHYGNLVVYLRIKGLVPPSSRK